MRTKIITALTFLVLVVIGVMLFWIFSDARENVRGLDYSGVPIVLARSGFR